MANSTQYGAFIETNFIWDAQELDQTEVTSPEFKELLIRLYQNLGKMATVINVKDTGFYQITEVVNGQLYFSNPANNSSTVANPALRQVLRKVINYTTALPAAAGSVPIPHLINCTAATTFTRIYATANDPAGKNYIPLPYASPVLIDNIELSVDANNVNIKVGKNRSNFTITYIVLEYLQS